MKYGEEEYWPTREQIEVAIETASAIPEVELPFNEDGELNDA